MPTAVPATWGTVRPNPNRIPEASSRELFGPGVMEPTNANPASPSSSFISPAAWWTGSWVQSTPAAAAPSCTIFAMSAALRRLADPEWVRAWRPVAAGVHEVFHARFVDYAYPPHVHDTWTVFIVDDGWIRYDLEARARGAGGERVTILPPNVVHDGRAAGGRGFRKRVLYLGTEVLDERLTGPAVDRPDIRDPALRRAVHTLHGALDEPDDALAAEAWLAIVAERLRAHLGDPPDAGGPPPGRLAHDLRDLLDGRVFEPTTLAQAGSAIGASPAHLVRSF